MKTNSQISPVHGATFFLPEWWIETNVGITHNKRSAPYTQIHFKPNSFTRPSKVSILLSDPQNYHLPATSDTHFKKIKKKKPNTLIRKPSATIRRISCARAPPNASKSAISIRKKLAVGGKSYTSTPRLWDPWKKKRHKTLLHARTRKTARYLYYIYRAFPHVRFPRLSPPTAETMSHCYRNGEGQQDLAAVFLSRETVLFFN